MNPTTHPAPVTRQEVRPTRTRRAILLQVLDERGLLDVGLTASGLADGTHRAAFAPHASAAKAQRTRAYRVSRLTWMHVAREAFFSALEETDEIELRERLVWLAAVVLAWIEAIDRRRAARGR